MRPESSPDCPTAFPRPPGPVAAHRQTLSPADPAEPGRLHELHAANSADAAAAAAAALLIALAGAPDRPLAWLRLASAERRTGSLYGPGLAELGVPPDRLLLAVLPDDLALLKAAADLLKSRALGAVLLELHGPCRRLDLTTSRRLALAAAAGNSLALLLRVDAEPAPSAAWRRWKLSSAPSRPLAARAPGAPAFAFELLRNRAGPAGATATLDWEGGHLAARTPSPAGSLAPPAPETPHAPALPRDTISLPVRRPLPQGRRAA
jgi:protein ImuA